MDREERNLFLETGLENLPTPTCAEPLDDIKTGSEFAWMEEIEKDHLSQEQWEKLRNLLIQRSQAFAKDKTDIGCCKYFKASLPLKPGVEYVYDKPRQLPFKHREIAEQAVQDMLEAGIIAPSKSPHSSNLVVVKKKAVNGEAQFRVCVDLRMVNANSIPNRYPNWQLEDVMIKVQGSAIRTGFDFANAFHQIALDEASIPVMAFAVNGKQYHYVRMPFGHVCAMNIFCNAMAILCRNFPEAIYYVDDLMVVTPKNNNLS